MDYLENDRGEHTPSYREHKEPLTGFRRLVYTLFDVPLKTRPAWAKDAWAGFTVGMYMGGILPFLLVVARKQLHMSPTLIGAISAAPFVGNLMALLWANAMQGRPKMPFCVWSGALGRGVLVFMLFAATPLRYALIAAVSQFLVTASGPAYAAVMKDIYPDAHRGRLMGYVRVLMSLANIVCALIAGRLLSGSNYTIVFPVAALFGVFSAILFGYVDTTPPDAEEIEGRQCTRDFLVNAARILHEDRRFLWFAMSVFMYGLGNLILLPAYPIVQVDKLHYGPKDIAVLTMVFNTVWMLSYPYWGKYVDTSHPLKAVVINVLITTLIPLNYIVAGMMHGPSIAVLFPSAVANGITSAGIELAYFNSVILFADEKRIPTYTGLHSCLLGIRGTIAPFIGAAGMRFLNARGLDYSLLFAVAILMMLAGMFMQMGGIRYEKKYHQAQALRE